MNNLLSKFQKIQNKAAELKKSARINNMSLTLLNGFNCKKTKEIYSRLIKHYTQHPDKGRTLWFESQLKLYFWVLLILSLLENKKIEQFNDSIWLQIKQIFPLKELYTFKYEARRILSHETKNIRTWNPKEDLILRSVMADPQMMNRWNQVARRFFLLSDHKYFRTGKQCREHWINHLDASKKHGKWQKQQDVIILKFVLQEGKKWSNISKNFLPNRTEHMIKNRYKSLITKFKKLQTIEETQQSTIIRRIIKNHAQKVQQLRNQSLSQRSSSLENKKQHSQQIQQNKVKTQAFIQEEENMAEPPELEKSQSLSSFRPVEHQYPTNCLSITPATNCSPISFVYHPFNGFGDVSQYWNNMNGICMSQGNYQVFPFGPINFFQL